MDTTIFVNKLSKKYQVPANFVLRRRGRKISALQAVDLQVKSGEVFAILGPNGAGKSTLVRILCGLILPSEGTASIAGYDIVKHRKQALAKISLCGDSERSFYYRISGRRNLEFFAALSNIGPRESKLRIKQLFKELELEEAAERPFMQYSSGERQKLGLARALLTEPKIILMDEPTKSLDPAASEDFWQLVMQMVSSYGTTVIFASHSINEVEQYSHRVVFLKQGQVVAYGNSRDVCQQMEVGSLTELYRTKPGGGA